MPRLTCAGRAGGAAAGAGQRCAIRFWPRSGPAIDVVRTDVAKDVEDFPCLRVMFDLEREDVLEGDVAFPNARMPLHLANAQRWMKGRVLGAILEALECLPRLLLDVSRERCVCFPEGLGRTKLHCWSKNSIMSSTLPKVWTCPSAMARSAARSFSCHRGVQK